MKGTEIVEKRNILNEIRRNNMTLQELRFFSIYLAKINARDINTRQVRFKLSDFQKIMEFGRLNINQIQESTNSLLSKIVSIPNQKGGYTSFQLFKECTVSHDEYGNWYIEIDAHDKALPLMFDFKSHYFTYELWNALRLKSVNQVRMYEILKQYEKIGSRELRITELRELLGITLNEYPRWNNFKVRVLDSCQQALAENTDISFTYEKGKSGTGGKWITILFHIKKNDKYIDRLSINDFIELHSEAEEQTYEEDDEWVNPNIVLYSSAFNDEFTKEEVALLSLCVNADKLPDDKFGVSSAIYKYLCKKYFELNYQTKHKTIKNRFKYLKKMIEADFNT